MSINVNDKNLGHATAYAYYKAGGGTMTEAEFTEFMADFGTASQTAVEAAQAALASKNAAQTAATTATNKATEATTAATTATTKAAEASTSASTATSAKDTAVSASQTATTKATEATTAAATATSAKTDAVAANTAAQSAKTAAQTAQTGAETAAASVQSSAAQIQTNADDISELKEDFTQMESDGVVPSAEQILTDKGITDSVPYHYRKTVGNGADRLYDQIVGGTVNFNQQIENGNFGNGSTGWGITNTSTQINSVESGVLSMTCSAANSGIRTNTSYLKDHKYIKTVDVKSTAIVRYDVDGAFVKMSSGSGNWETLAHVFNYNYNSNTFKLYIRLTSNATVFGEVQVRNVMLIDLTAMFGSTIADYIYSLETAHTGDGVAFFKSLFPNDYYPYNSGELVSVSGLSAHVMRDVDDNIIRSYPLDDSLTLRGLFKLDANNKLYADGDVYEYTGKVTRNTILRAYQSGDESLANAITDGTNTAVYSANASTEQADPYQHLQQCDPNGTEEYVSTGIVPVGHNSFYPENLRAKVEQLPWNFASLIAPTESTFVATRNYTTGALFIVDNVLYKATSNIANGGTITPNTNCTATTLAEIISALA